MLKNLALWTQISQILPVTLTRQLRETWSHSSHRQYDVTCPPTTLIDLRMGFRSDYQQWWHSSLEILHLTFKRPNRFNLLQRNVNQNNEGRIKAWRLEILRQESKNRKERGKDFAVTNNPACITRKAMRRASMGSYLYFCLYCRSRQEYSVSVLTKNPYQ